MPRLQPWLLRQARWHSRNLVHLLFACRHLALAKQELRWIRDHFRQVEASRKTARVSQACLQRGRGVPLQYILGSQPFGSLDIRCQPGALIPRPETEAYTVHLAELVKRGTLLTSKPSRRPDDVNIIDFGSGTGCIPLLLFKSLQQSIQNIKVFGLELSPTAVELSRSNIQRNGLAPANARQTLDIFQGDLFCDKTLSRLPSLRWSLMTSNPPYVSSDAWNHGRSQLSYSARKFEPKLALVPGGHLQVPPGWHPADVFYARLWEVAKMLRPRALLLEVGDEEQMRRVISCLLLDQDFRNSNIQIWRDWPDLDKEDGQPDTFQVFSAEAHEANVRVLGAGNVRSLFVTLALNRID